MKGLWRDARPLVMALAVLACIMGPVFAVSSRPESFQRNPLVQWALAVGAALSVVMWLTVLATLEKFDKLTGLEQAHETIN